METRTVIFRHCRRVHIVVLVVPEGGGGVLRTPFSGAPHEAAGHDGDVAVQRCCQRPGVVQPEQLSMCAGTGNRIFLP